MTKNMTRNMTRKYAQSSFSHYYIFNMTCAKKIGRLEEVQRELQATKKHCYVVMRQREGYQAQLRDKTLHLRKIIVRVKKENLKLKSEKFELGVKYHQVSDRLFIETILCERDINKPCPLRTHIH